MPIILRPLTLQISMKVIQDFQKNSNDEVDERSSEEYLRDLDVEYQERALLANSKCFIKRRNNISGQKANENTECYKCGNKGHFARDCFSKTSNPSYQSSMNNFSSVSKGFQPKFTLKLIQSSPNSNSQTNLKFQTDYKAEYKKMKAKLTLLEASPSKVFDEEEVTQFKVQMALADDELAVGKNHARNGEWVDITMRKGASPSSEVRPLTFQPHSPKKRPGLGIMKHTKPTTQNSSNNSVSGTVTMLIDEKVNSNQKTQESTSNIQKTESSKLADSSRMIQDSKPKVQNTSSSKSLRPKPIQNPQLKFELYHCTNHSADDCYRILYCMICKMDYHRTSDHETYIASLKRSENYMAQPYQYASTSNHILKVKAKPFPPCTHYGFNDHKHDRVIHIRGGVLAESSRSNESSIRVKCNTCRSTVHSTSDHNEFDHFKRGEKIQAAKAREPTKKWVYKRNYPKFIICVETHQGAHLQGTIFNANKEIVLIAPRRNDVYVLVMSSLTPNGACFFAKASESINWLWHKRLSHLNFKNINKLAKQNKVLGLPSLVYSKDKPCTTCEKGKHHRASFKTKQNFSIRKCLHLLHMDLFGPSNLKESYLTAVKRKIKYLKDTLTHGLYYLKCPGFDLKGYSDSAYTGCNMDKKALQVPVKYLVENWFVGVPRNSMVYQHFLKEFWSTVVTFDPLSSTDEPEKCLLKKFLIKFLILNGQRPLTLEFNTFCSSTSLNFNNGKYVDHPTPKVAKKELGKISINPSYLDKTPAMKNLFLMDWRILFIFVIQVLGGNYSSIEQLNSIQQHLAYSLITGTEVETGEISYSDLITKLLNKSRLIYVSYPRFISCALQVLLGSEYTQDKEIGFLPPILSNPNFTKDPSKVTDIELAAYMIAVNNPRDSVSPPPLAAKPKKGKSQTDKEIGFLPPILSNPNFTKDPSKVIDIELAAYMIAVNNPRDSVSPPPLAAKPKKGKSQTDDVEVRTPTPNQTQPEPSQVKEYASDSSSPNLKRFDNTLPLTERQLINLQSTMQDLQAHALKQEEASVAWKKSSTNMAWNLGSRMTVVEISQTALKHEVSSLKKDTSKIKSMMAEIYQAFKGLECNRSLLEGVPFVHNMVIEEPEYRIFFTYVFGDQAFQRWYDIRKVRIDSLVSYLVMASMVKTEENAQFSLKLRKLIADRLDQEKLKSKKPESTRKTLAFCWDILKRLRFVPTDRVIQFLLMALCVHAGSSSCESTGHIEAVLAGYDIVPAGHVLVSALLILVINEIYCV
nr:hypothetical protein [Tanacetum cinerariifolium]